MKARGRRILRVAALADVHAGAPPHLKGDKLDLLVEKVNAERPDVVVLTLE